MDRKVQALKAAFPHTVPIFTGFIFLGIAYGILMASKGFGLGWTLLMSIAVYAGSMQYVAIPLLASSFNPLYALMMALIVNARHLFYGVSMLKKFEGTGKFKPYLIFYMSDETFSVLCSTEPPPGVDRTYFMVFVTLLDQIYWAVGSAIGALLGGLIKFNTHGLDFALTALFVVIFLSQWEAQKEHRPAVIGLASSVLCLVILGKGNFVLPAMATILIVLTAIRGRMKEGRAA